MSSACLVCDVANFAVQGGPVGQAHSQEGGLQVTCGHLGNVSLGPAGHATKHTDTRLPVDHGLVGAAHEGW